jgi:hypothetical protein
MAGDWIKMRANLGTNPKVIAMANFLNVNSAFRAWLVSGTRKNVPESVCEMVTFHALRFVTIGALLNVWSAANEHTDTGFFPGINLLGLSDIAGVDGFGAAMESVGWAIESTDPLGVSLPHFTEYNQPGKARVAMTNAERQARYRNEKRNENSNGKVTQVTVEKRREENTPKAPKKVSAEGFDTFWQVWPKKVNKVKAEQAWFKLQPDETLRKIIVAAVEKQSRQAKWLEKDGEFIPHPSTWLNGRRWEDVLGPTEIPPKEETATIAAKMKARDEAAAKLRAEIEAGKGAANA